MSKTPKRMPLRSSGVCRTSPRPMLVKIIGVARLFARCKAKVEASRGAYEDKLSISISPHANEIQQYGKTSPVPFYDVCFSAVFDVNA